MSDENEERPLGLDLDAWDAQSPPGDFAERVLERVRAESKTRDEASRSATTTTATMTVERRRARRWGIVSAGVVATGIAAAIFLEVTAPFTKGEANAQDRIEVSIGGRAKAVLEPGAQVKWNGDDVEQAAGDVFYRVEPGAKFRVHTPAGDVEVKGTCFAVKVKDIAWDTGRAPDNVHPSDLQLELTLDVYKFPPRFATGADQCPSSMGEQD